MDRYPLALYRPGSQMQVWGRDMDMIAVLDEHEESEARADGWFALGEEEPGEDVIVATPTPAKRGPGRPRKVAANASV